jgi:hypothetical protein
MLTLYGILNISTRTTRYNCRYSRYFRWNVYRLQSQTNKNMKGNDIRDDVGEFDLYDNEMM